MMKKSIGVCSVESAVEIKMNDDEPEKRMKKKMKFIIYLYF